MFCTNCGRHKDTHFFCAGYTHGHCRTKEGTWTQTLYEEPRSTFPYAQRLALAEHKLSEFRQIWEEKTGQYVFEGKD